MRYLAMWFALAVAMPAMAGEVPCSDPLEPKHDNTKEYRAKKGPDVYDFLIFIPRTHVSQIPGDILECRLEIGDPAVPPRQIIIIANPSPETCWREETPLTWREPVTMWCSSVDATPGPIANTRARFKIEGAPPQLHDG